MVRGEKGKGKREEDEEASGQPSTGKVSSQINESWDQDPLTQIVRINYGGDSDDWWPRSLWLVAKHRADSPAYSLYKVGVAPSSTGSASSGSDVAGESLSAAPLEPLLAVAQLNTTKGKSFVSVEAKGGRWIVGVGLDTIIYDMKTNVVIQGPNPLAAMWCPVLVAHDGKIFALTTNPSILKEPDFPPWFEVLDLNTSNVNQGRLVGCSWKELTRPPCFPWKLTPRQFFAPPVISVLSYAMVHEYILVSLCGDVQDATYGFNTESGDWHKLSNKSLPFIGSAVPHGDIFLGFSRETRNVNSYHIKLGLNQCVEGLDSPFKLSIDEYKMKSMADGNTYFVSLNNNICCISCFSDDRRISWDDVNDSESVPKKNASVNLSIYQVKDPLGDVIMPFKTNIAISNQHKTSFKIVSEGFGSPILAAVLAQ